MFALPQMIPVPVFNFCFGGIDWPVVSSLLAWILVAALIASFLGVLRSSAWNTRAVSQGGFPSWGRTCTAARYHWPRVRHHCARRAEPLAHPTSGPAISKGG